MSMQISSPTRSHCAATAITELTSGQRWPWSSRSGRLPGGSIGINRYADRSGASQPGLGSSPSRTATLSTTGPTTAGPSPGPPDSHDIQQQPCAAQANRCYPPGVYFHEEKLPAPCAKTEHPSDALLAARRSENGSHSFFNSEGTTMYGITMTRYRPGGAVQYLSELRAALRRCPSVRRPASEFDPSMVTLRYSTVSQNRLGGDESLLLRRTYPTEKVPERPPTDETFLIAAIRFGEVVLVVMDYGWEGSASPRPTFNSFLDESIGQVQMWKP